VEVQTNDGSNVLSNRKAHHVAILDAWKPPHEWDCAAPRDIPALSYEEKVHCPAADRNDNHYISPNLSALQREVHMMAAASPELMLANIKSGMGDAADAMVYKELELTKKRWMFSALHQNENYATCLNHDSFQPGFQKSPRPPRVLAIYETHGQCPVSMFDEPINTSTNLELTFVVGSIRDIPCSLTPRGQDITSLTGSCFAQPLSKHPANIGPHSIGIGCLTTTSAAAIFVCHVPFDGITISFYGYSAISAEHPTMSGDGRGSSSYHHRSRASSKLDGS
jgi:hypothetical protein